jgi:6-phosphogluconolactonase (cycloisomerase 2 family)
LKAIILSFLSCLAFLLAGCGGSGSGPHIGSPIGPFVLTVNPASAIVASFKGNTAGEISPISSAATSGTPSALAFQANDTFELHILVTDSSNTLKEFNLDAQTGMVTPSGISMVTGTNPIDIAVWNGATVASGPAPGVGFVYVLNQGSNSISAFNITDRGGHLSEVAGSPFSTATSPQAIIATNLFNSPTSFPTFVYVANGASGTISGYLAAADGSLSALPGSPFAAGANIRSLAARTPFVFASDAGGNNLLTFKMQANGVLSPVGSPVAAGTQPGALKIMDAATPFLYVLNQGSNNVSAYKADAVTGALTPLPGFPVATGTTPVAFSIDHRQHMYIANQGSSNLSAFAVDFNTGALSQVAGSPFAMAVPPKGVETVFFMNVD